MSDYDIKIALRARGWREEDVERIVNELIELIPEGYTAVEEAMLYDYSLEPDYMMSLINYAR